MARGEWLGGTRSMRGSGSMGLLRGMANLAMLTGTGMKGNSLIIRGTGTEYRSMATAPSTTASGRATAGTSREF